MPTFHIYNNLLVINNVKEKYKTSFTNTFGNIGLIFDKLINNHL